MPGGFEVFRILVGTKKDTSGVSWRNGIYFTGWGPRDRLRST